MTVSSLWQECLGEMDLLIASNNDMMLIIMKTMAFIDSRSPKNNYVQARFIVLFLSKRL